MEPEQETTPENEEPVRTVVIKRHHATDASQLELHLNDIVMVLEKDSTGWWGGHKEGDEVTGWFPGFCVQPCPLPEDQESCGGDSAIIRNSALETSVSSPVRRSHAVASPQRHGIPQSSSAPMNEGANSTEMYSVLNASQQEMLEEKSQLCMKLDNEVTKLKQDKETLEEALRQALRQSSLEKEERKRIEGKYAEAETKLQAESSERKATLLKCEHLEVELRNKDEEVATLRRLSVASGMMQQSLTPTRAPLAQSPPHPTIDEEGPRRRLFPSAKEPNMPNTMKHLQSLSPEPVAPREGGCNASVRETSCCLPRSNEEPPVGYVKQLRNAFEARSATPQRTDYRSASRTRGRSETASRPLTVNTAPVVASAAVTQGGNQSCQSARSASRPVFSSGLAISTEPAAEEIVYGMSPINSQGKKDLKKSVARGLP